MWMDEYIKEIQRQLVVKYGFKNPMQVPDGEYPMEIIEGRIDNIYVKNGEIHCCNFRVDDVPNKWKGLGTENFRFKDLGRPAVFFLPIKKLQIKIWEGNIEENLHRFLIKNFEAFTYSTVSNFGVWVNGHQEVISDECRLYEVSFIGKEKISLLGEKLAEIAEVIKEECIYFKAGQYAALIYPKIYEPCNP